MIQAQSRIKICVLTVWFGQWPSYLPFFLKSCVKIKFIDWIIVSDQEYQEKPFENINFRKMSKQAFIETASKKLGFNITLDNAYKLCDFKPTFGKVFEDLLSDYRYWGYCDLDLVFGDILDHVYPLMADEPDIISGYADFLSGPFCLYRNTPAINNLFRDCPDHQQILQDKAHRAFDENIPREIPFLKKLYYQIQYLLRLMAIGPRYQFCIPEVRYHFQWYAKRQISHTSIPRDMTDLVYKAAHDKSIKAVFRELIKSDRALLRQGQNDWTISWKEGRLTNVKNGKDLCVFHFIDSKDKPGYVINPCSDNVGRFNITEKKIECK